MISMAFRIYHILYPAKVPIYGLLNQLKYKNFHRKKKAKANQGSLDQIYIDYEFKTSQKLTVNPILVIMKESLLIHHP